MERRNLLAGLAVIALSMFMLSGTAFAHTSHHKRAKPQSGSGPSASPETCVVKALPSSFMDQGEFDNASSVADIIEVECQAVYAEKYVRISANELYSRCDQKLYWRTPYGHDQTENQWPNEWGFVTGPSFQVQLDNDGNATAIVIGGPSCAAGESIVAAHLEAAPFTTASTGFTVLPPRPTTPGVFATPENKIEDETTSSVATIVQVEFPPVFAEEPVNVNSNELFSRCHNEPKTEAIVMWDGYPKTVEYLEEGTLWLDNDGNAFAVVIGNSSCAAGTSVIEASLENAPYTTYMTEFTIEAPQTTAPNPPAGS